MTAADGWPVLPPRPVLTVGERRVLDALVRITQRPGLDGRATVRAVAAEAGYEGYAPGHAHKLLSSLAALGLVDGLGEHGALRPALRVVAVGDGLYDAQELRS